MGDEDDRMMPAYSHTDIKYDVRLNLQRHAQRQPSTSCSTSTETCLLCVFHELCACLTVRIFLIRTSGMNTVEATALLDTLEERLAVLCAESSTFDVQQSGRIRLLDEVVSNNSVPVMVSVAVVE